MDRIKLKHLLAFDSCSGKPGRDEINLFPRSLFGLPSMIWMDKSSLLYFNNKQKGVVTLLKDEIPEEGVFARLRDPDRTDIRYIYYYFLTHTDILEKGFFRSAKKYRTYLEELEIPFRVPEKQAEVVAILETIQGLIRKRKELIEVWTEYPGSCFLECFGDPVLERKIPGRVCLSEVVSFRLGKNPASEDRCCQGVDEFGLLIQSAVSKGEFFPEYHKNIIARDQVNRDLLIRQGDLLMAVKNTPKLVGTTAYVFEEVSHLLFPRDICRLDYDKQKVSGIYLHYLLNDANFRKLVRKYRTGTLDSMSNLPLYNLEKIEIPLPELKAQKEFEEMALFAYSNKKKCVKQLAELEELLQATGQLMFSDDFDPQTMGNLFALLESMELEDISNHVPRFKSNRIVGELIDLISHREGSFQTQALYEKAKVVLFALLKEGYVQQKYDEVTNQMTLFKP